MKSLLEALFIKTLTDLDLPSDSVHISRPENIDHGEYTTNVAFLIGKQQKKNPIEIAKQIQNLLEEKKKQPQKDEIFTILQDIETISIAGPGFINLKVANRKFINQLEQVLNEKEAYGSVKFRQEESKTGRHGDSETFSQRSESESVAVLPSKPRITIEYTDPNPFKELHVGHVYSNAVGESLSRLYEAQGWDVRRVNYQGDVGLHVAKAVWGMLQKSKEPSKEGKQMPNVKNVIEEMEKKSLEDRAKWLGEAYVLGAMTYEEDLKAQEEIKQINILCFIAAQKMHEEVGVKPVIDYKKLLSETSTPGLEEEVSKLYRIGRSWSLEYFETQYHRLGTHFKGYYFESMVAELGYQIVHDHLADGIFEKSEGAIVFKGEKHGLHTRVFINKLGLPTYEAKELGLPPKKYEDWNYDRSIIVTGKEIDEYFKVLLSALKEVNPTLAAKTTHISHGMVRLPEGKMSSRTGKILTAKWLLEEIKTSMASLIDKNVSEIPSEERDTIAEKGTIAAIKYSLLKVSLPSDIAFDLERSVSFDGDSGPYLLYAYARCKSVLRKNSTVIPAEAGIPMELPETSADPVKTPQQVRGDNQLNPEEHALVRLILYFPEIVTESAENLSPSTIAHYLTELAQSFNLFYAKHKILGENTTFRLLITESTAQVLKNGLWLLGIETVERM